MQWTKDSVANLFIYIAGNRTNNDDNDYDNEDDDESNDDYNDDADDFAAAAAADDDDVLHWLPVPLRVEFKICLLVYKSLHGAAPGYLRDYCKETHSSASGLRLRSTDKRDLLVRRMKTRFGGRAFSAADPRCWNKLPAAQRAADSIDSFKTGLKTYLFSNAYSAVS